MNSNSIACSHPSPWSNIPRYDLDATARVEGPSQCRTTGFMDLSTRWRRSDQFRLLEPQINAQKVHVWPFKAGVPIELRLLDGHGDRVVSQNRHDYFEIFVVCSGPTALAVEDRLLPMQQGDLAIVGNTLHHSTQSPPHAWSRIGALYFDPNLISGDGSACSTEYLAPFLGQDKVFPHVIAAETGIPRKIVELMESIQEEMPGSSSRARLAIKTYLRMILILLVNHYATYSSNLNSFRRQQDSLESLHRFFEFLPRHVGDMIRLSDAALICNLSEAEFTDHLRQVTGRTFRAYLNHYRVERAQTALAKTDHPISEIAQDMGFCDQSYFGAVFLKITGVTPLAYRRRRLDKIST